MAPGAGEGRVLPVLQHHARLLMERADPAALAAQLTRLSPPGARQMPSVYFLRLGSRLEDVGDKTPAVRVYQRLTEVFPDSADAEVAWLRTGRMQENFFGARDQAAACYGQLLHRFPQGPMAAEARRALDGLRAAGVSGPKAEALPQSGGHTGMMAQTHSSEGVRYDLAGNPLP